MILGKQLRRRLFRDILHDLATVPPNGEDGHGEALLWLEVICQTMADIVSKAKDIESCEARGDAEAGTGSTGDS